VLAIVARRLALRYHWTQTDGAFRRARPLRRL